MDYESYRRTQEYHQANEARKRPGQKFCDETGWRLTSGGYDELRRPDKVTMMGGTIYRTHTLVFDSWYRNTKTGEHVLVEFPDENRVVVKRGVHVTSSPGCGFNKINLHINPDDFNECLNFYSHKTAADYLLRFA